MHFSLPFPLVNGTGAGHPENNGNKDIVGRTSYSLTNTMTAGVSGHKGEFKDSASAKNLDRVRYGLDLEYSMDALRFRGEYLFRTDESKTGKDITSTGWYILTERQLIPGIDGIFRYEQYDPDPETGESGWDVIMLGLNLSPGPNTQFSINYDIRSESGKGNLLTTQIQAVF